jgi:hypothetical protein
VVAKMSSARTIAVLASAARASAEMRWVRRLFTKSAFL